jgi:hypothetical protein
MLPTQFGWLEASPSEHLVGSPAGKVRANDLRDSAGNVALGVQPRRDIVWHADAELDGHTAILPRS